MKKIAWCLCIVGALLLSSAVYTAVTTQIFLTEAELTDGVVIDLVASRSSDSVTYSPVVQFETYSGQVVDLHSSTGSNPPSYEVGEIVLVYYRPDTPSDARVDSFFSLWGATLILGVLGALLAFLGGLFVYLLRSNKVKLEYYREHGLPVEARIKSVEQNNALEVNGKNPYRLFADWKDPATGQFYIFKSVNIWFDPSDYLESDTVTVFVDQDNPKKYAMDTSFLPE